MATRDEDAEKAGKYVEFRLNGTERRDAARAAGYSDKSKLTDIERVGGPVDSLMVKALADKGIDEEFIASEYAEGIKLAKSPDAVSADCNAHAKYLLQLSYLKGYGRHPAGPQVAVQINNNTGDNPAHDDGRIDDTLREVRNLLEVVREELGARYPDGIPGKSDTVAGGDSVPAEPETHQGVVPTGGGA